MARNDAYEKVRDALKSSGFNCTVSHILRNGNTKIGELRVYSNGREELLLKSGWNGKEVDGFDVFVNITDQIPRRSEDVVSAITARWWQGSHG